jgi:hypothetical protein
VGRVVWMHLRVVDVDFGVKGSKFPARLLNQPQQHALVLGYARLVRLEQHLPNGGPVKPLLCQPVEEVALGALNVDLQNVDVPMAERAHHCWRGGLQRRTARPAVRARRLLARSTEVPSPLGHLSLVRGGIRGGGINSKELR